jgi:hypothetical protein
VSAQAISRQRVRWLTRKYALPFTYGWARGGSRYVLRTHPGGTEYYYDFTQGPRGTGRIGVLTGPYPPRSLTSMRFRLGVPTDGA